MQRIVNGIGVGLLCGFASVASAATDTSPRELPDFMDCLQVFHEPERQHVRVTTLFCGSEEDGATPHGFEVRQHAVSLIDTRSQTVRYALHAMIRSEQPLYVSSVTLDSVDRQTRVRSQSSANCTQVGEACWYETAILLPLDQLSINSKDHNTRLRYEIVSESASFTLSLNRREIEAVRLFTEGLMVSLPDTQAQPAGNAI
jgi:hypothetical protein